MSDRKKTGKVDELAKKMEAELDPKAVLNLKYAEQNFLMQREVALYKKKKEKEDKEK